MSNVIDELKAVVNEEELKKEIAEAEKRSKEAQDPVPHDTYDVKIEKMEVTKTKKEPPRPMLSVQFKVLSGKHKNRLIFMNQMLNSGYGVVIANGFLRSLDSDIENKDIRYDDIVQYNDLVLDIMENIDGNLEYELEYTEKKGYDNFKIKEVYEVGD